MSRPKNQSTEARPTKNFSKWIICLGLVVVVFALFYPTAKYDFVNYDDSGYIGDNVQVQKGLTLDGFFWAFTTGEMSNWHPLTWLSYMLDVELFGAKPGALHVTNIIFHAINSLLVFLILTRITGALWRSAFVAAAFAIHPLHVESVSWISERKDVLSTFFWMLTIWAYARFGELQRLKINAQTSHPDRQENFRRPIYFYCLALFFFALGLMSKPMVVTLPFVLLLLDVWPLNRISFSRPFHFLQFSKRIVLEKIPFFFLTSAASLVTFLAQKKGGAVSSLDVISIGARVENAVVSYGRYLAKTIWPFELSVLYPHPGKWPIWMGVSSLILLIGISILSLWLIRRRAYIFVGWFWFVGTLVPVIGIVQVGMQSMADRYTYIPLIGLFIAITWGADDFFERIKISKMGRGILAGILLIGCLLLTRTQIGFWKNSETLFGHAVAVTKNNYIAFNNLGYFYSHEERYDEAITAYRKSLSIQPSYEDAHNNLGFALAKLGRHSEAIAEYRMALKIKPDLVEAHNNLGNSLAETGNIDEAITHYEFALAKNSNHADAHNNFGVALAMKGQLAEAIQHFQQSLKAKPGYASAHSNLGNAYAVQGKFDEAMEHYFACLKLKPDDSQAHNNLANVLSQKNRIIEAAEHYRKSLALNAKNPEANFNLALLLVQQGQRDEAIGHLREALRLKPNYAEAQRQLQSLGVSVQTEPK